MIHPSADDVSRLLLTSCEAGHMNGSVVAMVVVYCGDGVLVSLLTCTHFAGEFVYMSKKNY